MDRLISRRQWISNTSGMLASLAVCSSPVLAATSVATDKRPKARVTSTVGYVIDMQSEGKLTLGNDDKTHDMPFTVSCQQKFDERLIVREDIRLSTRVYSEATLQKRFGVQDIERVSLDAEDCSVVAFAESTNSGRMEFRTPGLSLTGDQWNLLQTPLSPIWLDELADQLFGEKDTLAVGEKIEVPGILAARLFCLEEVQTSDVICEVTKANSSQAVLKLEGEVAGRVLDAETKFRINSSLRCVFEDKKITQLRASFVESRSEGGVHPEFTATTKMKLDLVDSQSVIPDAKVKELLTLTNQPAILQYVSDNNPIQLQHSNQWHLVMDQRGEVTWRMIASGEALTQCKLLLLATKTEEKVSLKDWIEVVQTAHKEIESSIVSKETIEGQTGSSIHRVEVHGKENGADLAWIHYFVNLPDGTRGELAFTTDQSFVPTLGDTDRLMAESLTITKSQVADAGENSIK